MIKVDNGNKIERKINGKWILLNPRGAKKKEVNRTDEFKLRSIYDPDPDEPIEINEYYDIQRDKIYEKRRNILETKENPHEMVTVKYVRYKKRVVSKRSSFATKPPPAPPLSFSQRIKGLFVSAPAHIPLHKGFDNNEQVQLITALECLVTNITKAFESSQCVFDGDLDKIKLWFGKVDHDSIPRVIDGLYKMKKVLCNSNKILVFVDMRHQRGDHWNYSSILEPAPGLSTCYGKTSIDYINDKFGPELGTPDELELPDHLPHAGMRVLIGEHVLHPAQTVENRALMIGHQMTHILLGTLDKGLLRISDDDMRTTAICGAKNAQQMARDFPLQSFSSAENWAHFIAAFGKILPTHQ